MGLWIGSQMNDSISVAYSRASEMYSGMTVTSGTGMSRMILGITQMPWCYTGGIVVFSGDNITISTAKSLATQYIQIIGGTGGGTGGGGYVYGGAYMTRSTNGDSTTLGISGLQPTGDYLTTAALVEHTHDYQVTGNYLTTAANVSHTHSDLYIPAGNSTDYNTSVLSTKFLTTAAPTDHTHSNLYQSTGAYLTTAAPTEHTHSDLYSPVGNSSAYQTATLSNTFALASNSISINGSKGAITIQAGANITMNTSASKIEFAGAAPSGAPAANRSYIEIIPGDYITRIFNMSATQLSNRPLFTPFWVDGNGLIASTVRFLISVVTNTLPPIMTYGAALYTMNNSTQLGLFDSTTANINYGSTASAAFSGIRYLDITGMTKSMTEGRYVLAYFFSGAASGSMNFSFYGAQNIPAHVGFISGGVTNNTLGTANTNLVFPFWGRYSANSESFPNNVDLTQIYGGRSADLVDVYAIIKQI